jgi:hypothetical protein
MRSRTTNLIAASAVVGREDAIELNRQSSHLARDTPRLFASVY